VIALDAELCYSDGAGRVNRSFVYGSPLSVTQPASQAKIQLVEKLDDSFWKQCGPVMTPIHCDTAWVQKTKPMVTGYMALPSNQKSRIGKTVFRILDLDGRVLGDFEGKVETFSAAGGFSRAVAYWPSDLAVPGAHELLGIVYDTSGKELSRVAPRLVSVNMKPGY
jgi:hypothetical protein